MTISSSYRSFWRQASSKTFVSMEVFEEHAALANRLRHAGGTIDISEPMTQSPDWKVA
jgi:hypothetical protein